MPEPKSIILDWGTSSLRAALVSETGETLDTRDTTSGGIQFVKDGAFEVALMETVGAWFTEHGPIPVLPSGRPTRRRPPGRPSRPP